jgi:hypothetical protein
MTRDHHVWGRKGARVARLSALTAFMTFAIAVAAEAFSPPSVAFVPQLFAIDDCAPALTVSLATTRANVSGYQLKLVRNDAACALR